MYVSRYALRLPAFLGTEDRHLSKRRASSALLFAYISACLQTWTAGAPEVQQRARFAAAQRRLCPTWRSPRRKGCSVVPKHRLWYSLWAFWGLFQHLCT
eukprot:scaffold3504_cov240-Pinguiococcus_pyrenoidosus.AAC.47